MKGLCLLGIAMCTLLMITICTGEVGHPCTSKSECAADECCQIINIIVASRKRQLHHLIAGAENEGTCQKYQAEGDDCLSFEVLNGYCGCAPGLSCRTVFVGTPRPIIDAVDHHHQFQDAVLFRRDMRPGYASFCTNTTASP